MSDKVKRRLRVATVALLSLCVVFAALITYLGVAKYRAAHPPVIPGAIPGVSIGEDIYIKSAYHVGGNEYTVQDPKNGKWYTIGDFNPSDKGGLKQGVVITSVVQHSSIAQLVRLKDAQTSHGVEASYVFYVPQIPGIVKEGGKPESK